jgi:hypothetical protein
VASADLEKIEEKNTKGTLLEVLFDDEGKLTQPS